MASAKDIIAACGALEQSCEQATASGSHVRKAGALAAATHALGLMHSSSVLDVSESLTALSKALAAAVEAAGAVYSAALHSALADAVETAMRCLRT
ncbi:hypothetical protein FNF27_02099 [Cafeteria roenbergensis]|uniref:Uncharacterized protein n=1 Tax=Cafeteria roenbergensis TaxID=33653 RepID=A0A5A8EET0_CAFRO|nr:hypothetical protein FNF27_02099 [Cafeteria roenbergensis]